MSESVYPTGTIVLVKFPFAEATSHKVRPAIVVNTDLPNHYWYSTLLQILTSTHRMMFD